MMIGENKEPLALKDAILMAPLFATSVAISWEVGIFSVSGGFYFFSLSEHLVSAISALPLALLTALMAAGVVINVKRWRQRRDQPAAPWTTKKREAIFALLVVLTVILTGVGVWKGSLFVAALGVVAGLTAIIFGTLYVKLSDAVGVLCFAIVCTFLPFSAAFDLTRWSLDLPADAQSAIKLKSGSLSGIIIMAGERGILLFRQDTRTFLFQRADEMLSIEYRMPTQTKSPPPP